MNQSTRVRRLGAASRFRRTASLPLLASLVLASAPVSAQVAVVASAGTMGPTNYTTLKAAFDAVNAGTHQGIIGVSIAGNTTETASAILNASGGSASYTVVNIQPTGGSARSISGNLAGPLMELNGADNVTIDGVGSGGNSLTLTNTSPSNASNTSTLRFNADATGNVVKNCTILGSSTGTTLGTVLFSTGTTTGNDGNQLSGCNIGPAGANLPANAIYSAGSGGIQNSGNTIENCNLSDYFSATQVSVGLLLGADNTGWVVDGNRFFQTASRTYTSGNTHAAIQIGSGAGYTISDNVIGFASSGETAPTRCSALLPRDSSPSIWRSRPVPPRPFKETKSQRSAWSRAAARARRTESSAGSTSPLATPTSGL